MDLGFGAALAATISPTFTFLYGRLTALLDRGKRDATVESTPEEIDTPGVLEGQLEPLIVDEAMLSERWHDLQVLAATLGSYERNPERISADDDDLIASLNSLRLALEAIYEQRFTFRGESRERSGTKISQKVDRITGSVIGKYGIASESDLEVRQSSNEVGPGGSMIGVWTDQPQ
ncbi:hypothetical protein [Actinocatenispora comari]|jgi:hypothetical protein|uniref:Uncharacterized protein n=1 Tax=Actinocatenispora comari TaxID=2807577 RepID=A0A8J4ERF8_9ACTN|nr:hypothetical protein [Actinocatenispora comari]GIL30804.1 hypothetical protein NUM_60580 [Actinocatenispora comari]